MSLQALCLRKLCIHRLDLAHLSRSRYRSLLSVVGLVKHDSCFVYCAAEYNGLRVSFVHCESLPA